MNKGIAMNNKKLKELVVFLKNQGVTLTVKEFCSSNLYINQYISSRVQ